MEEKEKIVEVPEITINYDIDNKDIIYEITSSKDRLIIDSIKYKKYFKIINNKPNFDNLYLDIYTSASVITLNLSLSEDYSNMELFHQEWK